MINATLILLALTFAGEDKQYPPPLVEEWFDTITFIKVEYYEPPNFFYEEKVFFWRKKKPVAMLGSPRLYNCIIDTDEISPYLYWYDDLGEIWILPSEGKQGRWLTTGIWRKTRCKDIRFEYHSTKLTKLEDLLGIKEVRITMPQVPFGSDFKILEVQEKDLWEKR